MYEIHAQGRPVKTLVSKKQKYLIKVQRLNRVKAQSILAFFFALYTLNKKE